MKKIVILLTLAVFIGSLFASEVMQPVKVKRALPNPTIGQIRQAYRDVPEYQFVTNPTDLITSYYDYMPGSYNGLPVQVQPAVSQTYGYDAGGVYMVYHVKQTTTSNRREYYSYVAADGTVNPAAPIGTADIWEGYGGIDIDPVTADPFAAWHQQSGDYFDAIASYDIFHMLGGPGLWKEPIKVIDNPFNVDDEFIWPYVNIGPSPLGEDYRRVYVYGNNAASNTPSGNPSENMYFGYADFMYSDLEAQSDLEWTYFSIPLMDEWHTSTTWTRPFDGVCTSDDGKIAIMGYTVSDDPQYDNKMFVFLNDNYGEGDFTYRAFDMKLDVPEPQNQDGSYVYVSDDGVPYDVYFAFTNSGHMNAIFTDGDTKIRMVGALGLNGEDPFDPSSGVYWPYEIFTYTCEFDITNNTFHYQVLDGGVDPNAANPNYHWGQDQVYLPWDTDNDGAVDEFSDEGNVLMYNGWPCYFYDNDTAFHENNFKIVKNEEMGWLVAIWQDGLKAKYANEGTAGYEDWANAPEIAICTSDDNGQTWSDVLYLNAIDTPELAGMIPEYVYPGDKVEYIDDTHGKLHLMFMNDNSFGSSIQSFGLPNGGMMEYTSLNLQILGSKAEGHSIPEVSPIFSQNYPNPFQLSTNIQFNNKKAGHIKLEVYNSVGQKVKTLVDREVGTGTQSFNWDGTDEQNQSVSTGVYFYKLKQGRYTSTKKMILMK